MVQMDNKTICELVEECVTQVQDESVKNKLKLIKVKAGKMEDRLLKYCNSIENLGFRRLGRDYDKQ